MEGTWTDAWRTGGDDPLVKAKAGQESLFTATGSENEADRGNVRPQRKGGKGVLGGEDQYHLTECFTLCATVGNTVGALCLQFVITFGCDIIRGEKNEWRGLRWGDFHHQHHQHHHITL